MPRLTPAQMAEIYRSRGRYAAYRDLERFLVWFQDVPQALAYWMEVRRIWENL